MQRLTKIYDSVWSTVRDNFYNLEKLEGWERWQHRFDAKIKTINDVVAYSNKMLKSLRDPYTYLAGPDEVADDKEGAGGFFCGIGVIIAKPRASSKTRVSSLRAGSPAEKAGIKSGDTVVSVAGCSCGKLGLDDVNKLIRGAQGTRVRIGLSRANKKLFVTVTRKRIKVAAVEVRILPDNVGYIHFDGFVNKRTAGEMDAALRGQLKNCAALILDLRQNGGGLTDIAWQCSGLFIERGLLYRMRERIAGSKRILTTNVRIRRGYIHSKNRQYDVSMRTKRPRWNEPVVVLVDDGTASHAEILAGELRDNNLAFLIGVRTFGKGIMQSRFRMPGKTELHVTSARVELPKSGWLGDGAKRRIGLKPDLAMRQKKGTSPNFGTLKDKQIETAREIALDIAKDGGNHA